MLRVISAAVRGIASRGVIVTATRPIVSKQSTDTLVNFAQNRCFGAFSCQTLSGLNFRSLDNIGLQKTGQLQPTICPAIYNTPVRTVTKFSWRTGKRKTVKCITKRFYRLNWGIWIRPKTGSFSTRMWNRRENRKRRLRKHVFCSASQSWMLDKMVTAFWRRRHYYVDDPYVPYHNREEFPFTRVKPLP